MPALRTIVMYHPPAAVAVPWAALIVASTGPANYDVDGFREDGTRFQAANVPLIEEGAERPSGHYAAVPSGPMRNLAAESAALQSRIDADEAAK